MTKLIVFENFDSVNIGEFLNVYKESSEHNSAKWYPEMSEKEALTEYENGYIGYMQNEFFDGRRKLFVLSDGHKYLSALRLIEISQNRYYLEALETAPEFRKRGYGKELILQTEKHLKSKSGEFSVFSHVAKDNTASLNTHFAAGFEITADYYIENGETINDEYELTYNKNQDLCNDEL